MTEITGSSGSALFSSLPRVTPRSTFFHTVPVVENSSGMFGSVRHCQSTLPTMPMVENRSGVFGALIRPRRSSSVTMSYPPLPLGSVRQTGMPKLANKSGVVKPRTLQNIGIPSVYAVYPQKPITSVPEDDYKGMNNRKNPLRPEGEKRTPMLETEDRNFHNEKRSDQMKRMTRSRYHTAYEKYPYGSVAEREIYNRLFREGLKEQMQERDNRSKQHFFSKVTESREAFVKDQDDLKSIADKHNSHHQLMTTYRDANKELMEAKWRRSSMDYTHNKDQELELLRYNPINWSSTLK